MTLIREIRMEGKIDTGNSYDGAVSGYLDPAGVNVFTGTAIEILDYGIIFINVYTDVISAIDGLELQQSSDGINWDHDDVYTIPAGGAKNYSINAHARYFRVVYTNGAVIQTVFRLQTTLKGNAKPSSHRIQDAIIDDDDAELVKSVLTAKANGAFVNITATESHNLRVTDAESLFAIAKGDVIGHSLVHKFGKNEAVGTTFEPLSIGGIYQTLQPAAATAVRVKAGGNLNDTAAGTGAQEIIVQGLDETGTLRSEAIATAGASASALTSTTFIRVFRAYVSASGTYASAGTDSMAATIVVENGAGGTDWLTIHKPDIGRAQTQIGQYSVPLGFIAYVFSYLLTTDSNKAVDFLFFKRESILDAVPPYQARRTVVEEIGVQGHLIGNFEGGQKFTELTDIGWMVKAASAALVTVDFEIALVEN